MYSLWVKAAVAEIPGHGGRTKNTHIKVAVYQSVNFRTHSYDREKASYSTIVLAVIVLLVVLVVVRALSKLTFFISNFLTNSKTVCDNRTRPLSSTHLQSIFLTLQSTLYGLY